MEDMGVEKPLQRLCALALPMNKYPRLSLWHWAAAMHPHCKWRGFMPHLTVVFLIKPYFY